MSIEFSESIDSEKESTFYENIMSRVQESNDVNDLYSEYEEAQKFYSTIHSAEEMERNWELERAIEQRVQQLYSEYDDELFTQKYEEINDSVEDSTKSSWLKKALRKRIEEIYKNTISELVPKMKVAEKEGNLEEEKKIFSDMVKILQKSYNQEEKLEIINAADIRLLRNYDGVDFENQVFGMTTPRK